MLVNGRKVDKNISKRFKLSKDKEKYCLQNFLKGLKPMLSSVIEF